MKIKFSELKLGEKFTIKYSQSTYMKIVSILRVVEEPMMWASLGKQTRVNAVCIKSKRDMCIGTVIKVDNDMEVERISS